MIDVHVIAHTHWDREWYLTHEQYRARLVDLVDRVIDRMAADPGFTAFHLDGQTIVLEDYLEIRPEREAELRALVRDGRLLVGPWYVMPDMFLVSGESLVRNLALGLRQGDGFGGAMRVGYTPDPFGHIAQMPQILAGFSLEGAILWRGFGGPRAEYLWEAPDGSRTLLLHLPRDGYCNGVRLPVASPDRMGAAAAEVVGREAGRSHCGSVLLMVGLDHVEPHPALLRLVEVIDRETETSARLSTLPAYVEATRTALAATGTTPDLVRGELRGGQDYAFLLPGVLSARTYLKQANARVQRELEHWAEPLSVFARLSGAAPVRGLLQYAWKMLLQSHPHDSICGCSIDEVHDENMARFARARQAAEIATTRGARAIADRLAPAPAGVIRCVAINTDSHAWSGGVEATVEIPLGPARHEGEIDPSQFEEPLVFFGAAASVAAVRDGDGRPLAFQVLSEDEGVSYRMARYLPPAGIRVRRVGLAVDPGAVPALGYATVDVEVGDGRAAGEATHPRVWCEGRSLENDLLRVDVRRDGAVDVFDKRSGTTYSGAFSLQDVGDVGDEYTYAPPARDERVSNAQTRDIRVRSLETGPLRAALLIELVLPVPASAAVDRGSRTPNLVDLPVALEVRLRARSPIVEGLLRLENRARDHRLRLMFPTGVAEVGSHRADSAFGVVERRVVEAAPSGTLVETPVESEPMQSFADAGDAARGAVVVTDGLAEYEVASGAEGTTLGVTLVRSVGDLSRDDLSTRRGHAGPGLATPGAQCPGTHEFRVAFVPRAAPPTPRELYGFARAFLSPPRLFSPCGGSGELPSARSFLELPVSGDGDVILSACKPADEGDAVVLRMFNAGDRPAAVAVRAGALVETAYRTDLAERPAEPCPVENGRIALTVGPHRIETIALRAARR